ncbi:ferrous iron transport protein B [bacterium BMS3Abin04]|nr:ferrous iron transport protein B [bacterium BMS3Abin04]
MNSEVTRSVPFITLVGPPNSGKTTIFNYLSGKNYKTSNYPGSTVEYHTANLFLKSGLKSVLLDSPGVISLSPNSPDEKIAIDAIYSNPKYGKPDLIIVTIDASQISRHLLLAKELLDSGFKIVIALTMIDVLEKKKLKIDSAKLSAIMNCKVIKINGRNGEGVDELLTAIESEINSSVKPVKGKNLLTESDYNLYLIKTFKSIENIENKVIYPIVDKKTLKKANAQLKVLNNDLKKKLEEPDQSTLKIDRILLHKVWGLVIFFLIMALTFISIFYLALPIMELVSEFFGILSNETVKLLGYNWFGNLISNGVITGTGAVLVFIPQIFILFFILGFLEDSGYLARGAMLIDRPLSKIGLNGRSFVPMLSGFACAIPAIMAARTIRSRKERLLTIFIIPLMSCSARLPVYTLLIAFLVPRDKLWLGGIGLAGIYLFSILSAALVAGLVNKFSKKIIQEESSSSFILELPTYKTPKFSIILNNAYEGSKLYLIKAGTVILVLSMILWVITYFPNYNPKINESGLAPDKVEQIKSSERLENSYAASFGHIIEPIMTPIGMDWRVGVSLISAFAAREVFVSSLSLIFKVTDSDGTLQNSLLTAMNEATIGKTGEKLFTTATIIGLILFFVFALQCVSTLAISRQETGSWRIPMLQLFIYTSIAYILTFITVNGLRALGIN